MADADTSAGRWCGAICSQVEPGRIAEGVLGRSGPGAAPEEVAHDGGDDQGSGDDEQPLESFNEQAEETEESGKDK